MNDELLLEEEQFNFRSGFEREVSPAANADYGRWIQRALNAVLGLQLAVDGVVGQQTRSAIRGFQQRNGLTPDGVVGPRTQAALLAGGAPPLPGTPLGLKPGLVAGPTGSACASLKPKEILDNFRKDSADIKPEHDLKINQIALCIRDSQSGPNPIRRVEITGHASTEGAAAYNERLGAARSQRVAERLRAALKRVSPGLESRVDLRTGTRGEADPTGRGPEADRRVEILLPLKSAPPPPIPPPPRPDPEDEKRRKVREAVVRATAVLASQSFPAEQRKRLTCLMATALNEQISDMYINGKDFNVRQLAAGISLRMSPKDFVTFVANGRIRVDMRSPFFAPPNESDAFVKSSLEAMDERILAGINLIANQTQRNSELNVNNPILRQMQEFVVAFQRNPKSVYFCYGFGQK